jgi:hypothetical protein
MAQEIIDIGAQANDGSGDTIRNAGRKINENFTEVYALPINDGDIKFRGNNITSESSNADIVVKPSGTGNVVFPSLTFEDNNIKLTRSNDDLKILAHGSGKVVIGGLGFSGASIVGTDSAIVNINENLIVDATLNAGASTLPSAVTLNSTLDVAGATTLATLTVTGAVTLADSVIDNLTFNDNIIGSSSNADVILTPGGTGSIVLPAVTIDDNNITGTRSNENININASGTGDVLLGPIRINGTTIDTSDSTIINMNEGVIVDGTITANTPTFNGAVVANSTLDVTSGTTLSTLTVSGASSFVGPATVDNLTFNDNIIATSSNADLILTPGGTGVVNVSNLTIDSSINLTDNVIKVTRSNDNMTLTANGSGSVEIISGLTTAAVTTTGNVEITGNKTITGLLDLKGIQIKDNTIKTDESNSNLELSGNGSGNPVVDKVQITGTTIDNIVIGATTPAAGTFTSFPSFTNTNEFDAAGVKLKDNTVTAHRSNDDVEFAANGSGYVNINGNLITGGINLPNTDGNTGQLLRTDGSGQLSWFTNPILLGQSDIQDAKNTIGFSTLTELDANTAVGAHENIGAGSDSVLDEFDQSKYDSAWYLCLQRYDAADSSVEYAGFKTTIAQGTTDGSTFDAFDGTSQIIKTNTNDEIIATSSDVRSSVAKVRFKGQAGTLADGSTRSQFNALTFFRVGLGDNDSSGYTDGNIATKVTADIDSAVGNLDTFAHASYRGAKYYVSVNNTTTNEVMNAELVVVHNGSDAFIQTYNQFTTNSGNTPLATFTADISGSDVRLRGANGTAGTCRVTMYRILLADNESGSSGTYESVIAAQTVSNTDTTTINTDSFRGQSNPDMSSQKVINSWAKTSFDSVFYHMIQKDNTNNEFIMNKLSLSHGVSADGSTEAAGVADSHVLKSGEMNDISAFDTVINGSNVELKATGQSDGSTAISNVLQYYAIGLGPDTTTATSGNIGTHAGVTFGGANETRIDTLTATGTCTSILSTQRTLADFDKSAYDSAWFVGVSNDLENSGLATFKYSVMHGTTNDGSTQDAFITSSSIARTDLSHNHLETDVDISGSNIRLLGNGGRLDDSSKSNSNTMAYYRIGLGDNDSSGYTSDDGNADTDVVTVGGIQETTIDHVTATGTHATLSASGTTTCTEFTAGQYNGALIFVVNKDVANGSFETQKISMLHNLNDSFMTSSSVTSTDEGDQHPVYTTDMATAGDSTSKIRLRSTDSDGSTVSANNTMAYYRVGIGDDDSTGYAGELGLVNDIMHVDIIDSSVVNLDTFTKAPHAAAKYFINVKNQSTGETSNIEALVTHDNTNAYITSYNEHFSGNNSLITLTADISGSDVRLRGSATSGASTKVIVNRIVAFTDTESDEATTDSTRKVIGNVTTSSTATTFDAFQSSDTDAVHYVVCGQNGADEKFICEATVVTDGTGVFVSQGPNVSTKGTDMLELTATISAGTVSVKASSTSGASTAVSAYAVRLKAPQSSTATIDTFAASSFRGAKYFISLNNLDSNEVSNVEAMVVHDGTNVFINQYNEHFSGSASLINGDLTADISGGNVRLRCVVAQDNTRITFYKIILADAETDITGGTNVNVIGDVTVSSAATAIDTFVDTDIDGAHYVIIGYNSSEGVASIQEANVITNGTGAFVSSGPYVSTKGTNQLDLTAAHDGSSTVTLSASSTSGGSTKVNAYRIHMKAPVGQTDNLDAWAHASYRGAKYYISAKETVTGYTSNIECLVVHDGTNAYITAFNEHFSHVSLVTLTADISGGNVRLRCAGNIPDVEVKFYRVRLSDSESGSSGTDFSTMASSTVSSSATAIDTFVDTQFTGGHYVVVARNASEGTAEITEATVLTNGTTAFVAQANYVSSKSTPMLTLSAAHDGSSTVTLSAASTAGGSTTVNAYRIHVKVEDAFAYDVIDTFAHSTYQLANYIVVGKNAANQSQIAELMVATDGAGSYISQDGANISTHSTTTPLMNFTTAHNGSNVELRAENSLQNTDTTVNMYRIHLARAAGAPSSVATIDTFDKTVFRGAKYNVSISDAGSGTLGLYETLDVNVIHDGTNVYLSTFGRTTNHTTDLVEFTADISGDDVRLRGTISNTNTHTVTVVKRVMNI